MKELEAPRGRVATSYSLYSSYHIRKSRDRRTTPSDRDFEFSCSWRVGYAEPTTVALYCLNRRRMVAEDMQQQQMPLAWVTNKTQLKFGI